MIYFISGGFSIYLHIYLGKRDLKRSKILPKTETNLGFPSLGEVSWSFPCDLVCFLPKLMLFFSIEGESSVVILGFLRSVVRAAPHQWVGSAEDQNDAVWKWAAPGLCLKGTWWLFNGFSGTAFSDKPICTFIGGYGWLWMFWLVGIYWHFLTHDFCCFLVPTWLLGIQVDYLFFEGLKTTCKKRIA